MSNTNRNPPIASDEDPSEALEDASADRWDRRFRIEGEVVEALKVVVSARSLEKS